MNGTTADRGGTRPAGDEPVAIIVVHGVADQPRGETAEAVAIQLALETRGAVLRREVTLHVQSCKPAVRYQHWSAHRLWQAMRKSFFHALRSDFLDPRLGGADSEIATGRQRQRPQPLPTSAAADNDIPLGVRFTDFLIAKTSQARIEAHAEDHVVHTAACFHIEPGGGKTAGAPRLAVFEMYWADLSRLPGFVLQIVAELFTLLFDLVRIVERYVALLRHVVAQGYRRVVIVAHSQGTVITADLLCYLKNRPALLAEDAKREPEERAKSGEDNSPDPLADLGAALTAVEIDLLTVGCPLRQLYAQRFPAQYGWACNPEPAQLGVGRWFNAWGAADYVGRWLWSSGGPLPLDVAAHAYDQPVVDAADRRDVCIGPAAHTHYFEPEQAAVRALLMALLRPRQIGA